ncbi:MAG: MotA/TolQ/ExbB proton channel family protein [Spirochaetaceae bacterium]|nr:MotA/TolQ/ExbB proton channel family protein [Spirochaetaceae bacterium]
MFEVIKSGGIFMIPIILCGIFATYIIIERFIYFKKMKQVNKNFLFEVKAAMALKDGDKITQLCKETETSLAKVLLKTIECRSYNENDARELIDNEINRQMPLLERYMTSLGTIANISTLLGLLGTVTGNISAFGVLGAGGTMGNPALLAGAISEALITTAGGLLVSIPSLIFYNYFASRINKYAAEMDSESLDLFVKIKKGSTK